MTDTTVPMDRTQARCRRISNSPRLLVSAALAMAVAAVPAWGQSPPATRPTVRIPADRARAELAGRTVEAVRIVGNRQVATAVILNTVRTKPGEGFDPETVEADYKRIYALRRFANVEAKVEPTSSGGVEVVFVVTETRQINEVRYRGNTALPTERLQQVVEVRPGESIDRFRIALSRQAIEELYRDENFPFAHVDLDEARLDADGILIFTVVEGPNVRVRKVNFIGNHSFSSDRLKKQVQTRHWVWIFRRGAFDPTTVDDDVAALRRYYAGKGYFDARVGRRLVFSPDQREMQVDFLIEEGPRYRIDRVVFRGNKALSEADLRGHLRLTPGEFYDQEHVQRDVRQLVRAYSPFGFIYLAQSNDPDYLRIEPREVFGREPGTVTLVYDISEGKPFRVGRILVKGNARTQDKVVLREMRIAPGQMYDSGEVQDAVERLRGTPYFTSVGVTPIGEDPEARDLLVEVTEARTASFNVGAGVNSNGGVGGNITYEQRNFDISNPPDRLGELFTDRSFVGAGQTFRASFEPGTRQTNASLRFSEPWLFDQPYSFSAEAYLRDRDRRDYDDRRAGGRLTFGKRFNYTWSGLLTLRGEDVAISDIEDPLERSEEITDLEGHSTLTSAGLTVTRNTTNRGMLPARGTVTQAGWESFGALGGDFQFQRLSAGWDAYLTLAEDLLERKTILNLHADAGFIYEDAPFFERFYGGGIGSVRGFGFRGISPRDGGPLGEDDEDVIGGDFSLAGSAEISFPLAGDGLRGVVFVDAGTVEEEMEITTIRSSIGAGIRLNLPIPGQAIPLALDLAWPMTKDDEDDTQVVSFSFGLIQ